LDAPSISHHIGTATHAEFGTDGILAWGRWSNGDVQTCTSGTFCFTDTYNANQGLHYVVGMPTATMPTTGSATYSLYSVNGVSSATSPTYVDGLNAPGTLLQTSFIKVNFGAASGAHMIQANLDIAMSDGRGYNFNNSTTSSSSLFSVSGSVTGSGGACASSSCFGNVSGFFAGANADRAGVGYQIFDTTRQVIGAAALKKGP